MIDLHVHTVNSDGENTPSEVLKMANEIGITSIAITDHDSIDGVSEAIDSSKQYGIRVIPGIEITAYDNQEIHILGYNFDYTSNVWDEYKKYNEDICNREKERIFSTLNEQGIPIKEEDVYEYSDDSKIFKYSYVAKWLFDHGYGESPKDAYNMFFLNGSLEHIKSYRMSVKKAIQTIHSAGGIAVMAHPLRLGKIKMEDAKERINRYIEFGLDGVEAAYCMHLDSEIDEMISFCKNKGLKITLGSDYHGTFAKRHIKLGFGIDNNLYKYQELSDFIIKDQGL